MQNHNTSKTEENIQADVSAAQQTPLKSRKSKKKIITAVIIITFIVVGAMYTIWHFTKQDTPKTSTTTPATEAKPTTPSKQTFSEVLSFTDNADLMLLNLDTNKTEIIHKLVPIEQTDMCGIICQRNTDVSFDYSKIAMDYLGDTTNPSIGYYDRATKKIVIATPGYGAKWSPRADKLAYYDKEGTKVFDISSKKITAIENTKTPTDQSGVEGSPLSIAGWRSDDEFVIFDSNDSSKASFAIANAITGKKKDMIVASLSSDQKVRSGLLSPDGSKILANVDLGDGYDAGILNIDELTYDSISGNTSPRWPGSGYPIAGWSPDSKNLLFIDMFSPAVMSNNSASVKYQIRNLENNTISTINGNKAQLVFGSSKSPNACWIGNQIYLLFMSDDQNSSYIGKYDITTKIIDNIYNYSTMAATGLGCASAN